MPSKDNSLYTIALQDGLLRALGTNMCLRVQDDVPPDQQIKHPVVAACNGSDPYQQWVFGNYKDRYTKLADNTIDGLQLSDYEKQLVDYLKQTPS